VSSRFDLQGRCAVLTPPGVGAIAVIRAAGAGAWPFVRDHIRRKSPLPVNPEVNQLYYGAFVDRDETVDDVIIRSVAVQSDGGVVVDIYCHGGRAVVARLMDMLRCGGFDKAPSDTLSLVEFDCDPIEREVLKLIPKATTRRAVLALLRQRELLPTALRQIIARTEDDGLSAGRTELRRLLEQSRTARFLTQPATIAIVGPVNAGKSSLVNALAGREAAITRDRPGATLDYVTTDATLEGIHVQLIDTPGAPAPRHPGSVDAVPVDELAESAARSAAIKIADADLRVFVVDVERLTSLDLTNWGAWANQGLHVLVVNKIDRVAGMDGGMWFARRFVPISVYTGAGLDRLSRRVLDTLGLGASLERSALAAGRIGAMLAEAATDSSSEKFVASLRQIIGRDPGQIGRENHPIRGI